MMLIIIYKPEKHCKILQRVQKGQNQPTNMNPQWETIMRHKSQESEEEGEEEQQTTIGTMSRPNDTMTLYGLMLTNSG